MKGIFQVKEYIIQYANSYLSNLLNIPLDRIIGQSISDLFGEENKIYLQNAIKLFVGDFGETDKLILLKPTSNLPKLKLHLNLIEGKEKETIIVGYLEESTYQETNEYQIIRNKYNSLFYHALDGIIIYDYQKDEIKSVNRITAKTLQYDTEEEMIGLTRMDFIPKTSKYAPNLDLHKYTEEHKRRVLNGESFTTKGVFIGKKGKEIFFNSKVIPTFNGLGEGIILLQNLTNIIANKKNQDIVKRQYQNIFENSHEAIIYIDPTNKIPAICNANAMNIFDLTTLEEVRELRLSDFIKEKIIDGMPVHDYYNKLVKKALSNGREETSFWIHKKTGERIRAHIVLIKDNSNSEYPRLIGFVRDKTDLYKAQLALEDKNKELKKYINSNLQLENFAYFASHDLQTPLNTILSFTDLLQKKMINDDRKEIIDFLKFIVNAANGMKTLIDDLLTYSLVNTTNLEIKEINLEKELQDLLYSLDTVIKEKRALIEVHNMPESIAIDLTKLKQVFQNLITNSIKFTERGVKPKVVISCKEEKNHWLFSVRDNGIGISEEYQEKIFGLFKRLHSSREYKGTGIGLAIVKKIIEQHRGTTTLVSKIGKGTTFFFTIAKDLASVNGSRIG